MMQDELRALCRPEFPVAMTKSEILQQLRDIVDERLFGPDPWRFDKQTGEALNSLFERMGLLNRVPGQGETWRTRRGIEVRLDLMMVFMGLWEPYEMPSILERHNLIDSRTADGLLEEIFELGRDPDQVLLPIVRRCYFRYLNRLQPTTPVALDAQPSKNGLEELTDEELAALLESL